MVNKNNIEYAINKSIRIVKCHDYPKLIALRNFNESNFTTEDYQGQETEIIPSPVGILQNIQAMEQEKVEYESLERGVCKDYSTNSYIPINMYLNGVEDWEDRCKWIVYHIDGKTVMPVLDFDKDNDPNYEGSPWVDMTIPEEIQTLSQAIDKSPRVQVDSLVYRYGALPDDLPVGGHGKFKGFTSTSYNEFIAFKDIPEGGAWTYGEKRYRMRIYTPSGTKGIVLNRHTGCVDWQSELLLDKNQRYIILNRDDTNLTADILLY